MRSIHVSAVSWTVFLFLSGCSVLNSAVQISHVRTNTITDMQVNMKVGDKVTSNCTVIRVLGIPFGDSHWFSNKLADNVTYDTNVTQNNTVVPANTSYPKDFDTSNSVVSALDFILGVIGFNGVVDIKECEKVAAYKMVTKDGTDVIYAPRYISDSTGFPLLFRKTEVTLTGYKGNIVGFKQLDSQSRNR